MNNTGHWTEASALHIFHPLVQYHLKKQVCANNKIWSTRLFQPTLNWVNGMMKQLLRYVQSDIIIVLSKN